VKNELPTWDEMVPWDAVKPGVMAIYDVMILARSRFDRSEHYGLEQERRERELAEVRRSLSANGVALRDSALLISGAQIKSSDLGAASPKAIPVGRFSVAASFFPELFA